jgi:hypothetical protein
LRYIQESLFILSLDDATRGPGAGGWLSESQQLARILHGSSHFSANRWYDKVLNVIVGSDGVCGLLAEHSASEGVTLVRFAETFLEYCADCERQAMAKCVTINKCSFKPLNPLGVVQRNCLSVDVADPPRTAELELPAMDENHNLIQKSDPIIPINKSSSVTVLEWQLDDYDRNRLVEADLHLNRYVVDLHILGCVTYSHRRTCAWTSEHSSRRIREINKHLKRTVELYKKQIRSNLEIVSNRK